MPSAGTIGVFAGASVAILLIPGPAVFYIVTRAMDHGRRGGLTSAFGVNLGIMVHVAFAVLGLSVLLASSAAAFNVVKYVGAAYLIYVGVRRLLDREEVPTADAVPVRSQRKLFSQGVIVSVLNPKLALFFVAFLPQFVDRAHGNARVQLLIFGLLFEAIALCTDSSYALLAGTMGRALRDRKSYARAERYVAGGIYIALGAAAAATGGHRKA
ncbi:MAG TPA: LysE family translocator [Actinomycetota bacterium]|nr:LysE family translocator [Actinomycetota bacterium]